MLHFVYAFQPNSGIIRSPYCITTNLYNFLKERTEVTYHQWDEKKVIQLQPNDVLIGHPHYDPETVIQRTFREQTCRTMCTIHPLHTNRVGDNMPFDHLTEKANKVFSICGPYWYDTIDNTPFAHWKPKIIRLDMAVDLIHFPWVRESFNPPGERKFVYIGSTMPHKNLAFMVALMEKMPDVTLHWYGGTGEHPLAKLPNVKTVGHVDLNIDMARKITSECDIFINTSISDANPTTLLESSAWGIIPACTKESGYYQDPMFTELFLDNIDKTIQNLRQLLTVDESTLLERARNTRHTIETYYTWERFCNLVWSTLQKVAGKDLVK